LSNVERSKNQFKYNGQEYQDELELNMTAMDFRQYDSGLGRFHGVDLLAELAPSITPYRFGFNNPVYFSDPSGLFPSLEAAMAHINQYGLANATVSFGDVGWIVSNGGYNFFQSSNGTMWLSFVSNDGVNFGKLNGGGGGGSFSSGGFGSSNAGGFASSNNGGFAGSNNGGFGISNGVGSGGGDFYQFGAIGNALTVTGITLNALQKRISNSRSWVDAKGNIKPTKLLDKGANGKYVRGVQGLRNGQASANRVASRFAVAGKIVGGIGIGVTIYEIRTGQKNLIGEGGLDLIMGTIGFTGWGAPISLIYFGGKWALQTTGNDFWNN
jgi:RHS repeat-associated protein